jgi:hypothetical protein
MGLNMLPELEVELTGNLLSQLRNIFGKYKARVYTGEDRARLYSGQITRCVVFTLLSCLQWKLSIFFVDVCVVSLICQKIGEL